MSVRRPLRSEAWFNNPDHPSQTAIHLEKYLSAGLTLAELQSGRPIIGIANTGSDLTPCNRIHLELIDRVKAGIREAGGVPLAFPVHPLQETGRRPTAALDRNLAYLGLVEILHGYPLDGCVLTTGCDKTTPAVLMAAATTNLPSIVLSGGPMLNSYFQGKIAGAGTVVWEGRKLLASGKIDYTEFIAMVAAGSPSAGHCNTMGTALSMNSLAEALGMSLPGSAAIPAPYRDRAQNAYETGQRAVKLVHEQLTPSMILTREAFENAIVVNTAIGGSTNCPWHLTAIARHVGVELSVEDWQTIGFDVPLLVNCQPAGEHLGETFYLAGGVPAVVRELMDADRIHTSALTINGRSIGENCEHSRTVRPDVIRSCSEPLRDKAGFLVLSGNLFESALIKTSVISDDFRRRYLAEPGRPNVFESRVIVFDGPEDYHARINDPTLAIDERCLLVMRGCGPIGYPGSAEVVNMTPPDDLVRRGVGSLPCLGDGRQSGTSASPSILHVTPEAAVGGNLALLETNDQVRIDLNLCRVDLLVSDEDLARRRKAYVPSPLVHQTPWQEIYRQCVGQLSTGACLELATCYRNVVRSLPRDSH
ncbi:MAG: IlvD/Edd family dehydratase [Pirellulales bacterium]